MFQKKDVEKLETHTLCSITIFADRAVYEIVWRNTVEQGRPQMTVWRVRIACCIPNA